MATYNEKAWAFVRKAKTPYTAWDLARIAQISREFARKYLLFLRKAGYVKVIGKEGRSHLYRTIKITGIKPVRIYIGEKTVIDENLSKKFKIGD